jgi:hypothetical protein
MGLSLGTGVLCGRVRAGERPDLAVLTRYAHSIIAVDTPARSACSDHHPNDVGDAVLKRDTAGSRGGHRYCRLRVGERPDLGACTWRGRHGIESDRLAGRERPNRRPNGGGDPVL